MSREMVRALAQDAVPLLRHGLQGRVVDALAEAVLPGLQDLLQRAYEVGYREGLAASGRTLAGRYPDPAVIDTDAEEALDRARATETEDRSQDETDAAGADDDDEEPSSPQAVDWGDDEEGSVIQARAGGAARSPGIRPNASIGTLLRRIQSVFGLERFDVDVVVFRKGDRERRQLKTNVKLSKYLVER